MGSFRPASYRTVLRQETGIAPHHFDEEYTFVRSRGITNLVYTLHNGIQRRVVTDSGIRPAQVIVDGAGQTDTGHIEFLSKNACTFKRTVTPYDNQGINTLFHHVVISLFTPLRRKEFLAASRFQNRSSPLDDIAHILCRKFLNFVVNQSFITTIYTFYLQTRCYPGTRNSADSGIHSGSISSGSQNTYTINLSHVR